MTGHSSPRRVAIVTGATSGIGLAVGARLARDGFSVIGLGLGSPPSAPQDDLLQLHQADVRDRTQIDAVVNEVVRDHGRIDVLCNAAGIKLPGDALTTTPEALDETFAVNVKGLLNTVQAVLPVMIRQQEGAIINIGSPSALAEPASIAYSASKAAVAAITTTLAVAHLSDHIRVNLVVPGSTRTGMNATRPEALTRALGRQNVAGRINEPEDVAAAVSFLASAEAATISGAQLAVGSLPGILPVLPTVLEDEHGE